MKRRYSTRREFEKRLIPRWSNKFKVKGYSYPAGKTVGYHVDFKHQWEAGKPNWREQLVCPVSHLNNRMRASVHLFESECSPYDESRIYISEQSTQLYKYFAARYSNVTGSEFLGDGFTPGSFNASGIRHEDLTDLSFEDGCFDYFLSFDCFEHIPEYRKVFRECSRVIAAGGAMLFSVPFARNSKQNITRSRISWNPSIMPTR
jgi:SAM-dependent methyltransferase